MLSAWKEFIKGKRKKKDVQEFQLNLMDNIIDLHSDLKSLKYIHGPYQAFNISDPKPRNIHKAAIRDRLFHHAIYRVLYLFFDRTFIPDSYSCRLNKGTHRAIDRFRAFAYQVSKNHTQTAWVLKCDIKKFFASIDQQILLKILRNYVDYQKLLWLLGQVIGSFYSTKPGFGLPLGNLTSQLLVNIYMNEFDQFVKHRLKIKHYIRYADDFVILSHDKSYLGELLTQIEEFLKKRLGLQLHPGKVSIKTVTSGIDFLGWVHFPNHRILRTATKRRMLKRIVHKSNDVTTLQSYLGLLKHGNTEKIRMIIKV